MRVRCGGTNGVFWPNLTRTSPTRSRSYGRNPSSGRGGQRFESSHSDHFPPPFFQSLFNATAGVLAVSAPFGLARTEAGSAGDKGAVARMEIRTDSAGGVRWRSSGESVNSAIAGLPPNRLYRRP